MKLTKEQLNLYDEDGFIILHGILAPAELELLQTDAEILRTPKRGHPDANVYEKDGKSLRAAWAVEKDSKGCFLASRLPRLFGPVRQIVGEDTYLYQSRLNYKVAGSGDVFQWHQDYGSWVEDGVPEGGHRDMLTILIMLDDTREESGPLRFIPGSHKEGLIRSEYDTSTTSYALHVVPDPVIERLLGGDKPFQCTGRAGTVVIFSGGLVHGSQQNRTDHDRRNLYFAYNRHTNQPTPGFKTRKHANAFIMNDDVSPLEPVADDALVQLANEKGLTAKSGLVSRAA